MYIDNKTAKELLSAWGYTQKDVADRLEMKYNYVSKIINGKRPDKYNVYETILQMAKEAKRRKERLEKVADNLMPAA